MELDITGIGKSAPAHEIVNRRQANNQQAPKEARKVAQNLAKLAVESKKKR